MPDALNYFVLEPLRHRRFDLAQFRAMQVLHERTNGRIDELYLGWRRRKGRPAPLDEPTFINRQAVEETTGGLRKDGCSLLPRLLDHADIAAITAFAFRTPAYASDPQETILLRPDALPRHTARHVWPVNDIIRQPVIQKLMLDPAFASIAQEYLGVTPLMTSVTIWIDAPSDEIYDAHQYHYDNDGPGFLKFFFYLTDMNPETGAHCFIRGSHPRRKPEQFRIGKRYGEAELHAYYGRDSEVVFSAPKGTIFAEDTAGFHRGSTMKRDYRLVMQFEFSVLDIPHVEELDGLITPVEVAAIPTAMRPVLRKFMRTDS